MNCRPPAYARIVACRLQRRAVNTSDMVAVACMWRKTRPECIECHNWPLFAIRRRRPPYAHTRGATGVVAQFTEARGGSERARAGQESREISTHARCNDTPVDFPTAPIRRRRSYTDRHPAVSSLVAAQRTAVVALSTATRRRPLPRRRLAPALDNDRDFIWRAMKTNWQCNEVKERKLIILCWLLLLLSFLLRARSSAKLFKTGWDKTIHPKATSNCYQQQQQQIRTINYRFEEMYSLQKR